MELSKKRATLRRLKLELEKATVVISNCRRLVNAELARMEEHEKRRKRLEEIEERERLTQKILKGRKAGRTYKNIARELNMSPHAVGRMCRSKVA